MNEWYFFTQIVFVFLFSYGAMRLGKEALITCLCVQALLANFFVLKQITFLGFEITCSDAFAVGSMFSLNLLREYWDKQTASRASNIAFFFMVFFVVMSQLHLKFIPSPHDTTHISYMRLLTGTPRIVFASLVVFYLVQRLDIHLFGWIFKVLPHSSFSTRSTLSLSLSQLIDTIFFSFLGLFGMVANISHVILISFLIKLATILILGRFSTLLKREKKHV